MTLFYTACCPSPALFSSADLRSALFLVRGLFGGVGFHGTQGGLPAGGDLLRSGKRQGGGGGGGRKVSGPARRKGGKGGREGERSNMILDKASLFLSVGTLLSRGWNL